MGVELTLDESAPLPLACAVRQAERAQIHVRSAEGVRKVDSALDRSGVVRIDADREWKLTIAARIQHRDLDVRAPERTGHRGNKSDDQMRCRRSRGSRHMANLRSLACTMPVRQPTLDTSKRILCVT
jgi:hypothetical protein